jgi:hypothetical protein
MSPGGHLVTTAAACAASAMLTGSAELTAAIAIGGFFIDVDHAIDYVVFEKQRDLRPAAFLRYYLHGRLTRCVLALHSYELFAALGAIGWWTGSIALQGYLLGALMHLVLDIVFNGEFAPRSIGAFYSFGYRLAYRFDARVLLPSARRPVPERFWVAFFRGALPPPRDESRGRGPLVIDPSPASSPSEPA